MSEGERSRIDWGAFAQSMGYSDEELKAFRSRPNNEYVVENAHLLDRWWIVAEVIEAHGCAAGHRVGDRIYFSAGGVLETAKNPDRICISALSPLATAVAAFQERIISGLDPAPYLYRRVGCVDVGVRCGGWGHVSFELYVLPRE
jgi:uncharacterized repeat protein (TIGR04076 family)